MKTIENTLHVGATAPFYAVHISDTHLTYGDERDGERKVWLAQQQRKHFGDREDSLTMASALARKKNAPILHTGDLIDFVSTANLERMAQFLSENDCFLAAGNHEFSQYVGEAWEDADYRNQSLAKVQSACKNDIRMASRVIGGVNFVALDNGYYLFEEEQLEFLKGEAKKGLPIVLLLHTPLYEETLYDLLMYHRDRLGFDTARGECAYLVGVPEEKLSGYSDHRLRQQKADAPTLRTLEYLKNEPLLRAILCGHVHASYEGEWNGIPQLVTGMQEIRLLHFT